MKPPGVISAALLCLLLGTTALAYAQQEPQREPSERTLGPRVGQDSLYPTSNPYRPRHAVQLDPPLLKRRLQP